MYVNILSECGYFASMLGLSLSYNQDPGKMPAVADKLKDKYGGHNKFLESIVLWVDIFAPRYWYQQFDTYRVGMTKQSESTMHTILRNPFTDDMFEGGMMPEILEILNKYREDKNFDAVKRYLPESFLQRRICCFNYMTLKNMIKQRSTHKLEEWQYFIEQMKSQVEHPELL